MNGYTRHLGEIFKKAGAEPSPENRRFLDRAVREVLGMERADSREVWEKVKPIILGDPAKRKEFENSVAKLLIKYLITE